MDSLQQMLNFSWVMLRTGGKLQWTHTFLPNGLVKVKLPRPRLPLQYSRTHTHTNHVYRSSPLISLDVEHQSGGDSACTEKPSPSQVCVSMCVCVCLRAGVLCVCASVRVRVSLPEACHHSRARIGLILFSTEPRDSFTALNTMRKEVEPFKL